MEKIFTQKNLDTAKEEALAFYAEKNIPEEYVRFETIESPKKGLFGKMKGDFKVRAYTKDSELAEIGLDADGNPIMEPENITLSDKPKIETPTPIDSSPLPKPKVKTVSEQVAPPLPSPTEKEIVLSSEISPDKVSTSRANNFSPEIFNKVSAFLTSILDNFGIENYKINFHEKSSIPENDYPVVEIVGEKLSPIIGRHGETLDALQYLTILAAINGETGNPRIRFSLDCNDYRIKRANTLNNIAVRAAKKVLETHRRITLEPMTNEERRIVHAKINNFRDKGIYSDSIGEEPFRKIVVSYKYPDNSSQKNSGYNNNNNRRKNFDKNIRPRYQRSEKSSPVQNDSTAPSEFSEFAKGFEKNASIGKIDI